MHDSAEFLKSWRQDIKNCKHFILNAVKFPNKIYQIDFVLHWIMIYNYKLWTVWNIQIQIKLSALTYNAGYSLFLHNEFLN